MKEKFLSKRLPTILALIIIFISIWTTSYLIKRGIITIGGATENISPKNIKIVNVSDTSFTVTFTTFEKTKAVLNHGENQELGTMIYDDRDKANKNENPYNSHYITVSQLKPETAYYFSIVSEGNVFLDNEKNYSVKTASIISTIVSGQTPIQGKALLPDSSSAQDALVYFKTDNSQETAVVTNNQGEYSIPITQLRTKTLNSYEKIRENDLIYLEIVHKNMNSYVKSSYKKDNTIPLVTLSQNYDFLASELGYLPNNATPSSLLEIPPVVPLTKKDDIQLLYPEDNSKFSDQQPKFEGIAVPGKKVKITINSENAIEAEVTANNNGIWSFRPATNLLPGEHTITIETIDGNGILNKISRKFVVYAQGSQVNQSATSSGSIISQITPTPTKTIAIVLPTATPTRVPTLTPAPTRLPSPTPTRAAAGGLLSPSPSASPFPSSPTSSIQKPILKTSIQPTPAIAEPGNLNSSIMIISFSLLLIIIGGMLLFFA